ncbi:MAG: hypothetical protein II453_11810 [Alphaproteobacteria bacterium]|nr:hypothetical protein [Alphaproteobacteria bacterium]MBQ3945469.1 hypothetical protein [Alphaproteobacteria bacterium]
MQHFILRCKHCQKEYTYCTYGNGPEYGTEEGCSMDYCAECQKAIDKAFSAIPVKFKPERKEIKEPLLLELFSKIREEEQRKKKEEEEKNKISFPVICSSTDPDNYDNIETYMHKNKKYQVKWNDETPDEKHLFVFMEYDILKGQFTKRPWRYEKKDSYSFHRNAWKMMLKPLTEDDTKPLTVEPMSMPMGNLFFMDWDLTQQKREPSVYAPKPPQHVIQIHTSEATGECVRLTVKHGWYQTKVKLAKGVTVKNLIDFVDYKYTYEKYDDEDIATITKIECV